MLRCRRRRLRLGGDQPDGDVWKLTSDGKLLPTIKLPSAIERLTYADGALWAALGGNGTVVRIDPTTDATRQYHVGHFVTASTYATGSSLSASGRALRMRPPTLRGHRLGRTEGTDALRQRGGNRSRVHGAHLGRAADAVPLCDVREAAQLPRRRGRRGKRLVPEVAEDFPNVSDGGRTYTFGSETVWLLAAVDGAGDGESFRHALERPSRRSSRDYVDLEC